MRRILIFSIMMSFTPIINLMGQKNFTDQTLKNVDSSLIFCIGELVTVHIERTLYEGPNPAYFYIKVEIKNISDSIIGIDLSDKWKIIYPIQWGNLYTSERNIINEIRIPPDKLDSLKKADLIAKYKNQKLEFIDPNKSFIYYTEFNANGRAKIDKSTETGDFFYLSIDGQLFLTDGNQCERIAFEEVTNWNGNSVLTKPITWDKIEHEALIIERD